MVALFKVLRFIFFLSSPLHILNICTYLYIFSFEFSSSFFLILKYLRINTRTHTAMHINEIGSARVFDKLNIFIMKDEAFDSNIGEILI